MLVPAVGGAVGIATRSSTSAPKTKGVCAECDDGGDPVDRATGSLVYSSPAIADGVIYVGSADDKVYAFKP